LYEIFFIIFSAKKAELLALLFIIFWKVFIKPFVRLAS